MADPEAPVPPPEPRRDIARGRDARRIVYAFAGGLVLFAFGAIVTEQVEHRHAGPAETRDAGGPVRDDAVAFAPPPESAIPDGPAGQSIRHGLAIFENTGTTVRQYVGNGLACRNCHLDAGRKPLAAPMWAAWVSYPQYRSKNKKMNSMEDRLKGCFSYSMNGQDSPSGGPPPAGSPVYTDLEAYFHWLATGAPTGVKLQGAGFEKLKDTVLGYDRDRGRTVYAHDCASCHGDDGQGRSDLNGRVIFPPLWGPRSYNWGAGMAVLKNAAGFIKVNMPLGAGNTLTDQQAWDVAAWIDSQKRPRDPRQTGTVADAARQFHKGDFYGKTINGSLLGTGTPPAKGR